MSEPGSEFVEVERNVPRDMVICWDGTGNEYGSANSNVVKLYWTLSEQDKQNAYYHPGVGMLGAKNAVYGGWESAGPKSEVRRRLVFRLTVATKVFWFSSLFFFLAVTS